MDNNLQWQGSWKLLCLLEIFAPFLSHKKIHYLIIIIIILFPANLINDLFLSSFSSVLIIGSIIFMIKLVTISCTAITHQTFLPLFFFFIIILTTCSLEEVSLNITTQSSQPCWPLLNFFHCSPDMHSSKISTANQKISHVCPPARSFCF